MLNRNFLYKNQNGVKKQEGTIRNHLRASRLWSAEEQKYNKKQEANGFAIFLGTVKNVVQQECSSVT